MKDLVLDKRDVLFRNLKTLGGIGDAELSSLLFCGGLTGYRTF